MDATLIRNERHTTSRLMYEYTPTVRRNVGWPRNGWTQTSLKVEEAWMAYTLLLMMMMIKIIKSYPVYCWYILNLKFRWRSRLIQVFQVRFGKYLNRNWSVEMKQGTILRVVSPPVISRPDNWSNTFTRFLFS